MAATGIIDVSALVDRQKIGAFHILLLAWSFLVMLMDGYDIIAAAFAAPELIRQWHVERAALGPMLGASLFGIFVGSFLFGYAGDRWGRKVAIVAACTVFGGFTLAAAWAGSLNQLMVLRALAGIGIGGAMPNTISLMAEYAPKRVRATMVILMFTGTSFGGAVAGPLSNWLVPLHGWQALFLVGGIVPLMLAVLLCFVLPESIKFLALDEGRRARTVQAALRLEPGLVIGKQDRFVSGQAEISEADTGGGFRLAQLFRGRFAIVTPLLWLMFAMNLMVYYFINSWTPTLIASVGVPVSRAVQVTALFQLGGTVGGITLSRLLDRHGLRPVAFMFLIACPVVASIGFMATSELPLLVITFVAGFFLLGLQFGLNASSGLIYPTSMRANGVGWAFGVGRIGAIMGPVVGGLLIGMRLPIQQLYVIAAVPLLLGAVACFTLLRFHDSRNMPSDAVTLATVATGE